MWDLFLSTPGARSRERARVAYADECRRVYKRGASRWAVVVHVGDLDACQAWLVERRLARREIAVDKLTTAASTESYLIIGIVRDGRNM